MNTITTVISAGGVTALLLEALKWLYRKFVVKDMSYDFHPSFYVIAVPLLNVLVVPLLAYLGIEGYTLPADWLEFGRLAVLTALASLISLIGYEEGISPLKEYARNYSLFKG